MFGELPKLFDRNFVIGFFLPVAVFITCSILIVNPYPFGIEIINFLKSDLLVGTTALGLLSWVGGIVLLALNRDLYRFMEGYRKFNPFKLFGWMEKRRYQRVLQQIEKLDDEYRDCISRKKEFSVQSMTRRNELMRQLSEEFPDNEKYLLPTPFGNVLRSFEIYPRVMYGFEAIDGWGRLLAVIPKDYLGLIDAAKAQVDFWVNLTLLFILLQIEYIGLTYITGTPLQLWAVLLFMALGTVAPLRATSAAREWGDLVKSAFDVFRFKLLETLGVDPPENREEEKVLWTKYSQAIIFRLPDSLPAVKKSTELIKSRKPRARKS
jgi:hypothetical protein